PRGDPPHSRGQTRSAFAAAGGRDRSFEGPAIGSQAARSGKPEEFGQDAPPGEARPREGAQVSPSIDQALARGARCAEAPTSQLGLAAGVGEAGPLRCAAPRPQVTAGSRQEGSAHTPRPLTT